MLAYYGDGTASRRIAALIAALTTTRVDRHDRGTTPEALTRARSAQPA